MRLLAANKMERAYIRLLISASAYVHLSRRGLGECLDFVDFIFGKVQITSAHDSL
jgi:hypothetical protein